MRTLPTRLKKVTATRRGRIIAISIFLVIVLAVAGGLLYWNTYRKQIILQELENLVSKKSNGLYKLEYDSLKLDEVAGDLELSGIKLVYDSNRFSHLLNTNNAPPALARISIPLINVTGVRTRRALLNREIIGEKLTILEPDIEIIYTGAGKDSARYVPTTDVYRQILGDLDLIKIDTLEIKRAQITTRNLKTGRKKASFENTSILLLNVTIDENIVTKKEKILFSKQLVFECSNISFPSEDRPYNYSIDSISLNSASSSGTVKKIRIIPLLKEDAFVRSLPAQDDRFDFTFTDLQLKNLDILQLFREKVNADSLVIRSADLRIYRDLGIPRDKENRVGRYPHQLLDKLPINVQLKKLVLSNAFVEYKERGRITRQSGKVQFHRVSAVFTNLTNDKDAVKKNNLMTAEINARFLNAAPLKVNWRFYLQHPNGRFDIKGNLGSISAKTVSALTEPMGPATLEDGKINSLYFAIDGNDNGANATVKMLYSDLKIALLEKDEDSKQLDKKNFASFVANIVVKNDNPAKKEKPRVMNVHLNRDTNRSIFYLVWKTIFKGVRETVGINQ